MCARLDGLLTVVEDSIGQAMDEGAAPETVGERAFTEAVQSEEFETAFRRYVRAAYEWDLDRMKPIVERLATSADREDFLGFSEASVEAFTVCDTYFSDQPTPLDTPVSPAAADRAAITEELASRMQSLIDQRNLPYSVTQAEFQEFEGDLLWVFQFKDPSEAFPGTDLPLIDLMLYEPLRLYRDAVAPSFDALEELDVELFILSFRDPDQTVFEIDPIDLERYIDGHLSDRQFARRIRITGL